MVNGVLKIPSFLKRKNPSHKLDNVESTETLPQSPPKAVQRSNTASEAPEITANIDIPQKKHGRRVRTISGSSGHSCHSESTPRSRRFPNFSSGSNFSGDSIIHHLEKMSERDQVLFQAYRFGGR
jgi:hypothetical protein